jgi:hypothetical protein
VAEEQLGDPLLAAWAAEKLMRLDPEDPQARTSLARAEARRGAARDRLDAARAAVSATEAAGAAAKQRADALRALAAGLRGAPLEGAARSRALAELAARAPEDKGLLAEAYRAAWIRGDRQTVRAIAERQLSAATEVWQRVEARRQLAMEARARGAWSEANEATRPLLDEAPGHRFAASLAWTQAAIAGDRVTRARALGRRRREARGGSRLGPRPG